MRTPAPGRHTERGGEVDTFPGPQRGRGAGRTLSERFSRTVNRGLQILVDGERQPSTRTRADLIAVTLAGALVVRRGC